MIKKDVPILSTTMATEIIENQKEDEEDENDEELPFDMSNLMAQESSRNKQ